LQPQVAIDVRREKRAHSADALRASPVAFAAAPENDHGD